jgi:hypothetical protein
MFGVTIEISPSISLESKMVAVVASSAKPPAIATVTGLGLGTGKAPGRRTV